MYVCVYFFFNLRLHESRIERMPGYVSIQTFTPTLILVSYATTEPLQNGRNQIPSQSLNTGGIPRIIEYTLTNVQKKLVKVSLKL